MFTLRRRAGEGAVFMGYPSEGSPFFSMLCSPEEYEAVELRGWATLDGVKAFIVQEASDKDSGFLRLALVEPYRGPK